MKLNIRKFCFRLPDKRMTSLKNDVPTRWNSTLEMVESILKMKVEVDVVLKRIASLTAALILTNWNYLKI